MSTTEPITPAVAMEMATAAGLNLPAGLSSGVAARLNAMSQAARRMRPEMPEGQAPFIRLELPPRPGPGVPELDDAAGSADGTSDLVDLARAVRDRRISPVTLTEQYLQRISELNPDLIALITVSSERALEDARRAETELEAGRYRGPLHGIALVHKDLIPTKGIRTTYHTHHYRNHVPTEDAPIVTTLAEAGSVLLGKANTLELGSGEGDVFGLARNPWNPLRQVGGSSSGSAVAVAAGLAACATGTDAGGSIRIPAAFCGIVGVKPTVGLVANGPDSNGISVTGPMTLTVRDAALMLETMSGTNGLASQLRAGVKGMTVGVPVDWIDCPMEDEVEAAMQQAIKQLQEQGATIHEVRLPNAVNSEQLGALVTHVDCFGKYRHLLERGARLSQFMHELLLAAELYSASDYVLAGRLRQLLIEELRRAHEQVDVLITPMIPYRAALVGQTDLKIGDTIVNPRTGQGRFTRLSNLAGTPALSVPVGLDSNGMPLAVQFLGRPYQEGMILRAAAAVEWNHSDRKTPLSLPVPAQQVPPTTETGVS